VDVSVGTVTKGKESPLFPYKHVGECLSYFFFLLLPSFFLEKKS
jgi:hypothetical protein